jgi:hypothetical protein
VGGANIQIAHYFDNGYLEEEKSMIHSFTVTFGAKYLSSNSDTHRVNVSAGSCSNSDTHRVNVSADHHCQSSVKSVVTTEITTVISYKVLICEIPRISAWKS